MRKVLFREERHLHFSPTSTTTLALVPIMPMLPMLPMLLMLLIVAYPHRRCHSALHPRHFPACTDADSIASAANKL